MITRSITRPVTMPLARAITDPPIGLSFNAIVASIFANGEVGVAYDPNDLSTLFQDSAGTTPVTAAGQPVGLQLDKSRGMVRGPELYAGGSAGWTAGAEWNISGDTASVAGTGSFTNLDKVVSGTSANRFYTLTLEVISVSGGALRVALGGSAFASITSPGTYRLQLNAATSSGLIRMQAGAGVAAAVRISNPSVRELPGNHRFQATAASRPILRDSPRRIDYDQVDDSLTGTFPSSLGSNCTVARSIPGVGAQILTGQTIGTSFTDNVDNCGLIIVNRALTAAETDNLTRYLNQRAGV